MTMNLIPLVKGAGFEGADDVALAKLDMCCSVIVCNLIRNVMLVVQLMDCKKVQKKHFEKVAKIIDAINGKPVGAQLGGLVLPSEYFGHDSGAYFANVESHDVSYSSDVAREPLWYQQVGAGLATATITLEDVKKLVASCNHAKIPVAKDALELIRDSLVSNLSKLLKKAYDKKASKAKVPKKKMLNAKVLFSILDKDPMCRHMSSVWMSSRI